MALFITLHMVSGVVVDMQPFCDPCVAPTELYSGDEAYLNLEQLSSKIPRSTPDGVNPWPCGMVPSWPGVACNQSEYPNPCFQYCTSDRAGWWDSHRDRRSLPTNSWFTDIFSSSPLLANPQVFTWPVFVTPYAVMAAADGISVSLPQYLIAAKGGVPGLAGDIPSDVASGISPQIAAVGVDRIGIFTTNTTSFPYRNRTIASFDPHSLGVTLVYHTQSSTSAAPQSLTFHLLRGSPYVTITYTNTPLVLAFPDFVLRSVNGVECYTGCGPLNGVKLPSGVLKYTLSIWGNNEPWYEYVLYASKELYPSVNVKGQRLTAAYGGEVVVRVAVTQLTRFQNIDGSAVFSKRWTSLPDGLMSVDQSELDASSAVYPIVTGENSTVQHLYENHTMTVRMSWNTSCMVPGCDPSDLLMLTLPHHRGLASGCPAQASVNSIQYPVVNGVAVGCKGSTWAVPYRIPNVLSGAMSDAVVNHLEGNPPDKKARSPFYSNNNIKPAYRSTLTTSLKSDMAYWINVHDPNVVRSPSFLFMTSDCYSFGKLIGAVARLVLIADELEEYTIARVGRDFLRCRLNQWLDSKQAASEFFPYAGQDFPVAGSLRGGVPIYDTTWGGIPTGNGIKNPGPDWVRNGTQPDFGSGGYNDHLFHYGYYLYTVSVVLKGATVGGDAVPGHAGLSFDDSTCRRMNASDSEWFQPLSKRILVWARDIANPNEAVDPYFTQSRYHSDAYVGHSWARGLFPSGQSSSNIESTSEAMQAWYSLFLLGYAIEAAKIPNMDTEATALQNTGSVILLTEAVSVKYYWHLFPANTTKIPDDRTNITPEPFTDLGVVGNVWSLAFNYQVFFSYGRCQWTGWAGHKTPGDGCPYDLTLEQIHWFNRLFILQIQLLPYSPITETLIEAGGWLQAAMFTPELSYTNSKGNVSYGYDPTAIWDDLPSSYSRCNGTTQNLGSRCAQGWMGYAYQAFSSVTGNAQQAWDKALTMDGVSDGSTMTNLFWWIATRE